MKHVWLKICGSAMILLALTVSFGSAPDVAASTASTGTDEVTLRKGMVSCTIDPTTGKKRDFGGKTYTFASINGTDKYRTMVREYENAYNVKIRMDAPSMDLYLERVASMQAAGIPYDILYMYDTWFPTEITHGFVVPFDPYITTADLWDPVKKEGFSLSQLKGLAWNNHAYCAAGAYHSGCTGIFYNKKMFGSAGQPDLLDLYYKGQLTWERLYEIGSAINDPANGVYFINNFSNYYNSAFCVSYGTDFVKLANGGAKENLSDPQLATALQMFQKFTAGEGRLTDRTVKADERNGLDAFEMGTTASVIATPASWTHIRTAIEDKAVAFDKDIANIGWVPLPEQNAEKSNVMGSFGGIAIGAHTSEPYVAVTLAHWMSGHNHDGAYVDGMNEEIRKISCELLDKDNYKAPVSGFSSSAGSVQGIRNNICRAVAGGGDISSTLSAYKENLQRVLDAATSVQGHVHVYGGACDAKCNECEASRTATAAHIYDDEYDENCNACGDVRDVIVPDGWMLRSEGWKYYKNNTAQTGWLFVNDTWYFLKDDGVMVTGWVQLGNTWYYMNAGGVMATGWQYIDGTYYYLNESGAMHTGWLQLGNTWYYMNAGGVMATGWQYISGTYYYLNESGAMQAGWLQLGGTWYYLSAGGGMVTGWQYIGNTYYYFAESGAMQTGWLQLGGTWYYLSAGGGMVTGWQYIGNRYYYFAASGAMQTGWLQLGGTWYYLNAGGAMQTGWLQLGGTWYYLNAGGAMQTGWLQLGNVWYYMHPSGAMATGTVTVGGTVYRFDGSGVWIP
ncbi:MAG: hypothetical protein IJP14_02790 [Clostridia bacterium]|nr:hypothetical protein [Clostridia bacterium]